MVTKEDEVTPQTIKERNERKDTDDPQFQRVQEKSKHRWSWVKRLEEKQRGSRKVQQKAFNKHVSIVTKM